MTATTALYRRYRPDSFADVIGQEHVTEPLMTALRKNRVNHAYLFSGPRGCGKTTSARILARCLNCAKGPTDTPCGTCPSCIELARGGSGSLDVIEIDAASHGGVDDARDLRERATFAPVRDRYKIFIIDEAHMVTSAGFNALLKIVEEPPEHIKFIFATTEPDKVIGTIRSRTHHYPFRLVPPEPLLAYLELLCRQENVAVAPGVLSLVIRAGGGSVRDTLSVLDQLMAGAGAAGLDYELAVALLGYTHATLLDDVVDAIAASDPATVFKAVDRVIQTGHDPRRFVEDLLERFRDLIIVRAMPESASVILRGTPADQIARLHQQAHNLGASELSRAADVTNTALTEMTGATSPRLHLELLCARILLPSAEQTERGIAARIDRVERRLNYAGNDVASPAPLAAPTSGSADVGPAAPVIPAPDATVPVPAGPAATVPAPAASVPAPAVSVPAPSPAAEPAAPVEPAGTDREQITPPRISTNDWPQDDPARPAPVHPPAARTQVPPAPQGARPAIPDTEAPAPQAPAASPAPATATAPTEAQPAQPRPSAPPVAQPAAAGGHGDVEVLRRAWPDVLQTLSKIKRSTWALVEPNAKVTSFDGQLLTLAFTTSGLAGAFGRADHSENLRQAIHKTVGIDCQITAVAGGSGPASSAPDPKAPTTPDVPPTSVDEAWGLVPSSSTPAPTGTPAPRAATPKAPAAPIPPTAPAQRAPASVVAAPASAGSTTADSSAPPASPPVADRTDRTAAGISASPASSDHPPAGVLSSEAGTSSYSDDDWGPPLDEDAPPLEEEPPVDWMPPGSSRGAAVVQAPQYSTASDSESSSADATDSDGNDPWSRAVEQAPGVWQVGSVSNVSTGQEPSGPPALPAASSPRGTGAETGATALPSSSSSRPAAPAAPGDDSGWGSPQPEPETAEPPLGEPAYAMASAAPATAGPGQARATESSPVPASGRQSLYQRLSNSPEAQAGRARVAQATAAAVTPYIQDIPDPEDETIEESGVFGRAAVERILGGKLIDERSLDGSPLPPRF